MSMTEREAVERWNHAGLDCAMISSGIGFINGYVRLPAEHVGRESGYDTINRVVRAHGGLTYGADSDGWVGFDTGHAGDCWPGDDRTRFGPPERIWSLELLRAEVNDLAEQLAAVESFPLPDDKWDCTDAEFRVILRQAKAWRRLRGANLATAEATP